MNTLGRKPGPSDAVLENLAHAKLVNEREPIIAAQAANLAAKVDRIVVLMLENRSFDHMLGWVGPAGGGLSGNEFCPVVAPEKGAPAVSPEAGKFFRPFVTGQTRLPISPAHAGGATLGQINGGNMQGFLAQFIRVREREIRRHGDIGGEDGAAMPMATYARESLPAYSHLVGHELTCSAWHSSVPSGTWPNRMYLYSGCCGGTMRNGDVVIRDETFDVLMPRQMIVDLLDAASPQVSWSVYTHNAAWMRMYPGRQNGFGKHTKPFRQFQGDCKEGGAALAEVVFIDPRFSLDIGGARLQNDDLAPADLIDGQQLVADIYLALAQLPTAERERTLLVVTYDEHGGFYDHVLPPPTIGKNVDENDDFDTYGIRVPAFVCSAWAPAGSFSNLLLDHASLYATLHRRFVPDAPFPSRRAQVANTLGALLTRQTPRAAFPTADLPGNIAIGHRARQAERQARREDRQEDRADRREDRQEDRQEDRANRRDDRQDDRAARRDDRQDDRSERRDDRHQDRSERRDDRQEDRNDRHADRPGMVGSESRRPSADADDDGMAEWIRRLDEPDGG